MKYAFLCLVLAFGAARLDAGQISSAGKDSPTRSLTPSATFVVTKTADTNDGVCDGDCSIREALSAANADPALDTIVFNIPANDAGCTAGVCVIRLTSGELSIAAGSSLTINGTGADQLLISGNNASRVLFVNAGANVSLSGLTITQGNAFQSGGGIYNNGATLMMTNCIVSNSTDREGAYGGGIFNDNGTLNLANSTVSGNAAGLGGGVANLGGAVTIANSIISGNLGFGGGIYIRTGTLDVTGSIIAANGVAPSHSGGIQVEGGTANIIGSAVVGNFSEGLYISSGTLNLANSTVNGNSSTSLGGGIYVLTGTANLTNSTISGNSSGAHGVYAASGTLRVRNTIVAGNAPLANLQLFGTVAVNENNLIGGNALLAPLGSYGGATQTQALLSGSPSINAGNDCVVTMTCATFNAPVPLPTDQRGAARVGQVDIGAFELNNSANGGNFRATLPTGRVGTAYNFTLVPSNGTTTYAVTAGALPPGMNLTTAFAPSAVVSLTGTPTSFGVFNFTITATNGGNTSVTDYTINVLAPTAAGVSVSGRVMTSDGRGLRNATVTLTDASGVSRNVRTSSFGYFRFEDIAAGQVVTVEVRSKRFNFTPQVVFVGDEVVNLEFVGTEF